MFSPSSLLEQDKGNFWHNGWGLRQSAIDVLATNSCSSWKPPKSVTCSCPALPNLIPIGNLNVRIPYAIKPSRCSIPCNPGISTRPHWWSHSILTDKYECCL